MADVCDLTLAVLMEGLDGEGRVRLTGILNEQERDDLSPLQRDLRSALGV